MTYTVESYDAFDAPSERRHLKHGEFQHGGAALVTAQVLIDKHLLGSLGAGKTAAEALDQWRHFGEVPMIFGDPRIAFDPFAYAERRAAELGDAEHPKPVEDLLTPGDQPAKSYTELLQSGMAHAGGLAQLAAAEQTARRARAAEAYGLPASFPEGTRFASVEGVPVSCTTEYVCRAWDSAEPRRFPIDSFLRNGEVITEARFREWVAEFAEQLQALLRQAGAK